MKELKIKVAVNKETNKNVYPDDPTIPRGEKAGVICLFCRQALGKKHGDIREPHFYHINNKLNCSYSKEAFKETEEHRIAKELIKKSIGKEIYLPSYDIQFPYYKSEYGIEYKDNKYKYIMQDVFKKQIDRVEIEKTFNLNSKEKIRADAIIYVKDIPLIIEFKKTHAVEKNKINIIKKLKISCIEIDLNLIELDNLLKDTESKKWIYNKKNRKNKLLFLRTCRNNIKQIKKSIHTIDFNNEKKEELKKTDKRIRHFKLA